MVAGALAQRKLRPAVIAFRPIQAAIGIGGTSFRKHRYSLRYLSFCYETNIIAPRNGRMIGGDCLCNRIETGAGHGGIPNPRPFDRTSKLVGLKYAPAAPGGL
jgi:hypothetical protein